MKPVSDTLFVLNPKAGNGRAGQIWGDIIKMYPWVESWTITSESPSDLANKLIQKVSPQIDRVIAVGGDGSAHHLINAVIDSGLQKQVAVGLFPAGSGSDLWRNLEMPGRLNAEDLFIRVMRSEPKAADLIRIHTKEVTFRAVNICSVGISAEVALEVNSGTVSSRKNYLGTAILKLLKWHGVNASYAADDDKSILESFDLLLFANGSYFGNGIRIVPGASVFDGKLHALTLTKQPLHKLLAALSLVPLGWHKKLPWLNLSRINTAEVKATGEKPLAMEADGEVYQSRFFAISLETKAIRLLC